MTLAAWLVSLVGPLVARAVIALGFTAVSFAGVTVAMNSLVQLAQTSWSAMPSNVLAIASLSGIPECLGMMMSAYAARIAVWAVQNGSKYILGSK
jgi:uncharacterized membrane protein